MVMLSLVQRPRTSLLLTRQHDMHEFLLHLCRALTLWSFKESGRLAD